MGLPGEFPTGEATQGELQGELANMFAFAIMLSPVRLSVCPSVVCLSVTLVHPTEPVEIFGNVCTPFGTSPIDIHGKFHRDRPRGTPPLGFKRKRVAKYSDFGPIEGYISETVQDRR